MTIIFLFTEFKRMLVSENDWKEGGIFNTVSVYLREEEKKYSF